MAKWMVAAKKADFNRIAETFGISPVLARILRNREIIEDEEIRMFLQGTLEDLHSPFLMKGMEEAAELLLEKIAAGVPIRVIGDYDVDGICATYIMVRGLRFLGGNTDRRIPHRILDGYGLNDRLIREACEDKIDTILTCDNGIAAFSQILEAKQKGMTVVVTDHHAIPYEEEGEKRNYRLPPADVVIDPWQEDCTYPFPGICGAVVAYKLVEALLIRKQTENEELFNLRQELLPFAALATICDVMDLQDENRILVRYGLREMARTDNPGLKALLLVNEIGRKEITPYHAGFIIGPCLNATGRLDSADRALCLFEEEEWNVAVTEAADLKSLNDSRKKMTEDGVKEAIAYLEQEGAKDRVLVIYLPGCHESIAGIIAGRIRERYYKPTFILTRAEEGIKGSGRSIESYHMYEELSRCRALLTKFGGHKMAAGLSLAGEEDIPRLRRELNANCTLTEADLEEVIHIDVPMPMAYADMDFVRELQKLEPFGAGNPKPVFAQKNVSLLKGRILGKNRNAGKYTAADENGRTYELMHFGDQKDFHGFLSGKYGQEKLQELLLGKLQQGEMVISIVYYPSLHYYGGREEIQLVLQHYC